MRISRVSQTIQTQNAISVGASTYNISTAFIDCDGFSTIAVTLLNDLAAASDAQLLWSNDGVSLHGQEVVIASNSGLRKAGSTTVKARYAKVQLDNGDTSPHTMSAWVYLSA